LRSVSPTVFYGNDLHPDPMLLSLFGEKEKAGGGLEKKVGTNVGTK
jgi:hypothetical protein